MTRLSRRGRYRTHLADAEDLLQAWGKWSASANRPDNASPDHTVEFTLMREGPNGAAHRARPSGTNELDGRMVNVEQMILTMIEVRQKVARIAYIEAPRYGWKTIQQARKARLSEGSFKLHKSLVVETIAGILAFIGYAA